MANEQEIDKMRNKKLTFFVDVVLNWNKYGTV